ncbi:hypothetical protein EV193_116123 [Herbihabitans rhizosphaerae]|uniref:YCII-related domain-containing protein n=1 Tax=Herbihabitans rhizosphaerae TaxID=1872711 RepID=A0A4V2ERE8_9PSEU|nr:YciI family protein [Herbihabitans rhizosphaerae]RZS30602.1 hypothetical protein EV193_116123 [Herbihabitans rhizosphaerae]
MYIVELSFDDSPERLAVRPAHRQKLSDLREQGKVLNAGPFADGSGAVVVFDVETEDEVRAHMADDVYYSTAGVTVASVREWTPLFD